MADVLIVCVREDEPQAKALADMFEAAGFTIGGAPSSDGALRSSGAGVVVWSQASIRSRPFLDAAQRVINAEKAVVASLIEPPPPASIGDSPAFDLSGWDGDPNDPALDPLFFAVDRMVNAARAAVGAAAPAREETFDPPVPLQRTPPPRAAAPPTRRTPPPAPKRESPALLGPEAEHWRAIRDSRDATDFLDYLERYGPDGAFAEVAELRLKQLTDGRGGASSRPGPRPAPRQPSPPRVETSQPPQRHIDLAQTRAPAPPRASAPPRRPPIEHDYTRDLRDPPKSQGGALRAIVAVALLGGVALAGLYLGGGMDAPTTRAEDAAEGAHDSSALAATPNGDALEEAPSVPLAQAVAPQNQARERERERANREREEANRREREQERARENAAAPSQTVSAAGSGPVPLTPGPASLEPPPVQIASVEPTITAAQPPETLAPPSGAVQWAQRPSARRIAELYPARAQREEANGRVVLECRVLGDLSTACAVLSETPPGLGFGRAALSASSAYRARPTLSNGASAIGSSARIAVTFQSPQ